MLQKIHANQFFYLHTVTFDQKILSTCFSELTFLLFYDLFERLDENNNVSLKDRKFYAHFFSYSCCGVLVTWICEGFKESAEEILSRLMRWRRIRNFLLPDYLKARQIKLFVKKFDR